MKQQIIVFFAIVATLQFCSTTASPVETSKAKEDHEQKHEPQPTCQMPKVNMQKVEAVKTLCDVLINSSNAQKAAEQHKLEAHKESEHTQQPHQNHEGTVEHAENNHAENKHQQNASHSGSSGHEQHENQQESSGAQQGEHHHHHHHHLQNAEGQTGTLHTQ